MIGIALLGAGLFAQEQHLPAIQSSQAFELRAVYSRSLKSASALSANSASPDAVTTYADDHPTPSRSLADLLARTDVSAVIICLPIPAQPDAIRLALAAGKHVLSEKPIAPSVADARALVSWHQSLARAPVWAVAENYRFVDPLTFGAAQLRAIGGAVVTFRLDMFSLVADESKYFNTAWRKTPAYQGGFLLDGGVHFVAALRLLLGAVGEDVSEVSARTALLQAKLAPVDTVHAVAKTDRGAIGTMSISFGTEFKSGFEVQVVTTEGSVTMTPVDVKVAKRGQDGKKVEERREFTRSSGVPAELEAFGASLEQGTADERQNTAQALKDLAILQGLLESGAADGQAKQV
ncbi:hypothetical protein HYQ45_000975 [Verticillium longisporum]|uniref:Gfo/Idh/MocA-like oxidoreductase N-terminal domain-containing protein n=1 Tax=Verticillium longisporum TaxID=100787 RepID=A0A8I3AWH1_VERLO|nr:hypothetical protein HYQ45_000975 [Verticillium longisporum]RBQ78344.1 hypothetical protein VDGD_21226 [Verticillium dahliae]